MAGVITALKWQKKRKRRVNVYLDGEFAFGLAESLAASLQVGQRLDELEVAELQVQDEGEQAYQRGLRLISRRPRSEGELRRYFDRREISAAAQERAIDRLKDRGLVDDRAFARAWIENRNAFRPRGALALRAELKRKGVASSVIIEALDDFDEGAAARTAAQKRISRWVDLSEADFRRRMGGYLRRRGFPFAIVREVVRETWGEIVRETREGEREGDV
jgi:regulatory protein